MNLTESELPSGESCRFGGGAKKRAVHFPFIDALRGYAILGVIVTHCAQHVSNLAGPLRSLTDRGGYGVQLFFIVSAVTLISSWRERMDGIGPFFIRRLFRIAPMFWLAIPLYLFFGESYRREYWAPDGISLSRIIETLFFVNGWHPQSINSVVPGGWSIAVEMTFYLLFPLFVRYIRTLVHAIVATLTATVCCYGLNSISSSSFEAIMPGQPAYLIALFREIWFFNQLPVFMIGFAAFFLIHSKWMKLKTASLWIYPLIVVAILLPFIEIDGLQHIQHALCFGFIALCLARGAGGLAVNRLICLLGKVSFSAYLVHFVIIDYLLKIFLHAPRWITPMNPSGVSFLVTLLVSVLALTVGVSICTYHAIESPMIKIGNKVARLVGH